MSAEQERAAALADKLYCRQIMIDPNMIPGHIRLSLDEAALLDAALRAYARPAPDDLREAIEDIVADIDNGVGRSDRRKIADAVIALLPQTQAASDVLTDARNGLLHAQNALASYRLMLAKHSPDNAWVGGFERDMQAIKAAIERLDRAAGKEG